MIIGWRVKWGVRVPILSFRGEVTEGSIHSIPALIKQTSAVGVLKVLTSHAFHNRNLCQALLAYRVGRALPEYLISFALCRLQCDCL
jgi:hypothetical protein